MEKFRISVRSLVEFLLHSGDIDGGKGGMADKEACSSEAGYTGKYRAAWERIPTGSFSEGRDCKRNVYTFRRRTGRRYPGTGRADHGDEIKGVYRSLDAMEKPDLLHLAQAKCYAAIYGSEQKLDVISVQMTYCNLETEEIRRFVQEFSKRAEKLV